MKNRTVLGILLVVIMIGIVKMVSGSSEKLDGTEAELKAVKRAEYYAQIPTYPPATIKRSLVNDGFTVEEANFGVRYCDVDWDKQAISCAEMYFESPIQSLSAEEVYETMVMVGFTEEQTEMAVEKYLSEHQ